MSNFTDALYISKKYKDSIMVQIKDIIVNNGMTLIESESENELIVDTQEISEVSGILNDQLNIPEKVKETLLDIYSTKKGTFIRLKFN